MPRISGTIELHDFAELVAWLKLESIAQNLLTKLAWQGEEFRSCFGRAPGFHMPSHDVAFVFDTACMVSAEFLEPEYEGD